MNINDLAKEVHANAVSHGWWDGERKAAEIVALIHTEWSEALEEARAGKPMVYYNCMEGDGEHYPCAPASEADCLNYAKKSECEHRGKKPEGIAVELIDGCIRILDAFAFFNVHFNEKKSLDDLMDEAKSAALPSMNDISFVVSYLHYETSMLFMASEYDAVKGLPPATFLLGALGIACAWVREQGLDPMKILLEKHEYNKTRPYKHGKKF